MALGDVARLKIVRPIDRLRLDEPAPQCRSVDPVGRMIPTPEDFP